MRGVLVKNESNDIIDDTKPVETKAVDVSKPVQAKTSQEKKVEIQWTIVKRCKRKARVFIFGSRVKGETEEVTVVKAENNQKVPVS